ncbi:MAG: DUF5076 domain-containing protein [Tatlockia sp.]|nr:DUF5076 domain-containing protein [Tatlockia sp.]
MKDNNKQLLIPQAAQEDPDSYELIRVWIAKKSQHCSIRTGIWDDPAAWGIILADLARLVVSSYEQDEGYERIATLQRIRRTFDIEMDSPTDDPKGKSLK